MTAVLCLILPSTPAEPASPMPTVFEYWLYNSTSACLESTASWRCWIPTFQLAAGTFKEINCTQWVWRTRHSSLCVGEAVALKTSCWYGKLGWIMWCCQPAWSDQVTWKRDLALFNSSWHVSQNAEDSKEAGMKAMMKLWPEGWYSIFVLSSLVMLQDSLLLWSTRTSCR